MKRYACVYRPPASDGRDDRPGDRRDAFVALAEEFSPRYERRRDDLISIDVSGLDRLLGPPAAVGAALGREAAARLGPHVHVALAGTASAAVILALARPGLTIVEPGTEADALAPLPVGILEEMARQARGDGAPSALSVFRTWGINTLGELAALPPVDLAARLGRSAAIWQTLARGEDVRPFVPTRPEERFEASFDPEWPIEGLEPLSFVLTRLIEPLAVGLERRDRGVAVLHVELRLVTPRSTRSGGSEPVELREVHVCRLELPSPMRDVRTLRTLVLLDLESRPPGGAVDRVTVVIDPTPGRIVQHTLFERAHPMPERLSTLVARLNALMGQDRVGAPATVDSYRPGAFVMEPFADGHSACGPSERKGASEASGGGAPQFSREAESLRSRPSDSEAGQASGGGAPREVKDALTALRRCRHPVPVRVAVSGGRPVRVTADRRGWASGSIVACAGPWRTSGDWWSAQVSRLKSQHSEFVNQSTLQISSHEAHEGHEGDSLFLLRLSEFEAQGPRLKALEPSHVNLPWDRDEWDVALAGGAVYRIVQDRESAGWFIDGVVD